MIPAVQLLRDQRLDGACPSDLTGICRDSRKIVPGEAFVSMAGDPAHAIEAAARGAAVHIGSPGSHDSGLPRLTTSHPRWTFARASASLHGLDRNAPILLGATGTKGKSTIVHFTQACLGQGGCRIGTTGWHDGTTERPNPQTTPPPEEIHAFLARLPSGCPGVALEVSSHASDQHRLAGLRLAALAFTGLGHDHLDYHGSPAAYLQAKLRSLRLVAPGGRCVVNAADSRAHVFAHGARSLGLEVLDLGEGRRLRRQDADWMLDGVPLPVPLPGAFNAWNAAAAVLLAESAGVPRSRACQRLAHCPAVPGRLELLARSPLTYVDYAHTPESISLVIAALRSEHPGRPLAIVFGCGGDRDPSKRGPMGSAASDADLVVITTDNSRSEDPLAIAAAIIAGLRPGTLHISERDRATAILQARQRIGRDGVVVVAGKGHETTQNILGQVLPWDDRAFVRSLAS